ncbi:helix-turn-helix domain-containing protein [Blastomonas sp.]|uniref:helix-turn-helix domain-containing protein n=1 Tax=Blastomonas sp. TaxID=1909299 RepID=UPI00391979CF
MAATTIIPLTDRRLKNGSDRSGAAVIPADDEDASSSADALDRGIPIRSISRAIAVLQAINRGGSLNMMEIAQASKVPYPTACRIVQTLVYEQLVERERGRKRYRPTAMVQSLSHGFTGHSVLLQLARPHIAQLTRDIGWPVTISTHVGSTMVLRDSTHSLTSLTFNEYHPGFAMPILECASGIAYLAFCDEGERNTILGHISPDADDDTRHMLQLLTHGGLLATVRKNGYSARSYNQFTRNPGKTSSIAVPLMRGGKIEATLSVAFFAAAVAVANATKDLLPPLQKCAKSIEADLDARTDM